MNLSCPAIAFASALIVAASALQASVITPPVQALVAPATLLAAKTDAQNTDATIVLTNTCETFAMPICGITDSTANGHHTVDLLPRDLLLAMAGEAGAQDASSWSQVLPVVIEVYQPSTAPALFRDAVWTVPVSAARTSEITIVSGHWAL